MERGTRYTKLDVVFELEAAAVHVMLCDKTERDIGCRSQLHLSHID